MKPLSIFCYLGIITVYLFDLPTTFHTGETVIILKINVRIAVPVQIVLYKIRIQSHIIYGDMKPSEKRHCLHYSRERKKWGVIQLKLRYIFNVVLSLISSWIFDFRRWLETGCPSLGKHESWLESLSGGHSEIREECWRWPSLFWNSRLGEWRRRHP